MKLMKVETSAWVVLDPVWLPNPKFETLYIILLFDWFYSMMKEQATPSKSKRYPIVWIFFNIKILSIQLYCIIA